MKKTNNQLINNNAIEMINKVRKMKKDIDALKYKKIKITSIDWILIQVNGDWSEFEIQTWNDDLDKKIKEGFEKAQKIILELSQEISNKHFNN